RRLRVVDLPERPQAIHRELLIDPRAVHLRRISASAGSPGLVGAEIGLAMTGLGMGIATGPLMTVAVGALEAARSGTA
ncbi:hypothetical protein SB759_40320, partial [Pseudomonas sp. SIMBA_059]